MYTLYTDKAEDFKCNIGVEGAKLSDTQARLVLKNNTIDLIFEGKVASDGKCIIPIKQLKNILDEGTKGDLMLEVIAEGTFFSPWNDKFEVKTNKKVTIDVSDDDSKEPLKENKIEVKVEVPTKYTGENHGKIIAELLTKKGINILNLKENTSSVTSIMEQYIKKYNVTTESDVIINQIIENLESKLETIK